MQSLRRYTQNVEHSSTVRELRVFLHTKESEYSYVEVSQGSVRKVWQTHMENPDLSCTSRCWVDVRPSLINDTDWKTGIHQLRLEDSYFARFMFPENCFASESAPPIHLSSTWVSIRNPPSFSNSGCRGITRVRRTLALMEKVTR